MNLKGAKINFIWILQVPRIIFVLKSISVIIYMIFLITQTAHQIF
jgi:hypothetical protein